MTPATPHRSTTAGSRSWHGGRRGAESPAAAILTVAGGIVAVLTLALALRENVPGSLYDPDDEPNLENSAGGLVQSRSSDRQSIEPSLTVASENETVLAMVLDLRQVSVIGPAAKGEIDDLLCRLRALLTPANAAEVARALSPQELATPIGTVVLEAWLAADSGAASAWIATQSGATDHHAWLVAEALTRQPERLAAFCETLGTGSWAQAFLDYSSRELLPANPVAAVSLAESMISGERQMRLFETIACDWMLRDPAAAREWINGLEDPSLRHRLVAVGAPSYASIDPLGALEWLLAQSPAGVVPQQPLKTIAGIWLHSANTETVAWLNDLLADDDGRADRRLWPQ